MINVDDRNFIEEVIKYDGKVLVDFYAVWCGPCKMLSPIIEQVASERPDVKICKVNVDESPVISSQFGIMSIPTLIAFENGAQVAKSIGLLTREEVLKMLG